MQFLTEVLYLSWFLSYFLTEAVPVYYVDLINKAKI
jgi:hypothetical protein